MFGKYKPGVLIDLAAAKKVVSDRLALCAGRDFLSITDVTGVKNITKEARDYFSKGDGVKHMIRLALIIGSPITRMMSNFWLEISKPAIPTRTFTSEKDARAWLSEAK